MLPEPSGVEDKQLTGCLFERSDDALEDIWTIPVFPSVQNRCYFGPYGCPQIAVRSTKPVRDLRCC